MCAKHFVKNEQEYEKIKKIILNAVSIDTIPEKVWKIAQQFTVKNGYLYLKNGVSEQSNKLVVAQNNLEEMEKQALDIHHENHCRKRELREICNNKFHYIKESVILKIIQACEKCTPINNKLDDNLNVNLNTGHTTESNICIDTKPVSDPDETPHMEPNSTENNNIKASHPNERFLVNIIDVSKHSNNKNSCYKFILTVVDIYSKFGIVRPMHNMYSITIVNSLERIFYMYGACKYIHYGRNFIPYRGHFKDLLKFFSIQSYGQKSRYNAKVSEKLDYTISRHLSNCSESTLWHEELNKAIYGYNITVDMRTNKSPFMKYRRIEGFNPVMYTEKHFEYDKA